MTGLGTTMQSEKIRSFPWYALGPRSGYSDAHYGNKESYRRVIHSTRAVGKINAGWTTRPGRREYLSSHNSAAPSICIACRP